MIPFRQHYGIKTQVTSTIQHRQTKIVQNVSLQSSIGLYCSCCWCFNFNFIILFFGDNNNDSRTAETLIYIFCNIYCPVICKYNQLYIKSEYKFVIKHYTVGTVNYQYTLNVKFTMVVQSIWKSEVSPCKSMQVHRVCVLNVALFFIDQDTIHANKQKKFL